LDRTPLNISVQKRLVCTPAPIAEMMAAAVAALGSLIQAGPAEAFDLTWKAIQISALSNPE
jgi:hypothetical protein